MKIKKSNNNVMKARKIRPVLLACLFLLSFTCVGSEAAEMLLNNTNTQVCFSPGGRCTSAITKEISQAKTEILVQAYSFTSAPIAQAFVDAHKRGVRVEVILDKSQRGSGKYSSADFLAHAGISVFIDAAHAIAHNKIIIIDKETVITGSFNFTKAAEERNAENLLILKSTDLAVAYMANWEKHKRHSEKYEGK